MPPNAPEVVWDGKQLSIHAENSTLFDILAAVRARTGATIDIPTTAAAERVVLRLGPAPVREVLTSLLYGTDYDYIIQASDTNPDTIRSVIITPHGKGDDVVVASVGSGSSSGNARRMPGYTDSGKPTFEKEFAPKTDQSAEAEPAESAAPNAESSSASAEPASTASPQAGKDASAASGTSPADSNSAAANDTQSASSSASPSLQPAGSDSTSGNQAAPTMQEMTQDLQRLYQQRRQIQSQQNQQNQAQPSPAN